MPVLTQDLTVRQIAGHLTAKDAEALRHIGAGVMRSDAPHDSAPIKAHIGGKTKTYTMAVRRFQASELALRDGARWTLTAAGQHLLRFLGGAL